MDNHFHLLFYQVEHGTLSELMKSVTSAYVAYFNRKQSRSGPLLESRFKAALVANEAHLTHISRYIHLNPRYWLRFPHSSLRHILGNSEPEWLQTHRVVESFVSREAYVAFVADYEAHKLMLATVKRELADT
jgi:hypothetical protein